MLNKIVHSLTGGKDDSEKKMKGRVVLMKKNVLDFNDLGASVVDRIDELMGNKVTLQLVSAVNTTTDSDNKLKGKVGKVAYLQNWITTITSLTPKDSAFDVDFDYEEDIGVPGAFIIRNSHHTEFYLKTLTLENVPGHGRVHFVCNSWIYPAEKYETNRIFFTNQVYLPSQTPKALVQYRQDELKILRGDGSRQLEEWDRVYDYALYNDLGDPDKDEDHVRPVLGGSKEYPYPRRGRTGRPPSKTDPNTESRIPLLLSLNIYVPRDERFGHLKMSDFLGFGLKSISQVLLPEFTNLCDSTSNEFDDFEDVLQLYKGGLKLPNGIQDKIHLELLKQLFPADGEGVFKFPVPQVIETSDTAWRTDEEFAREMLAGINPMIIRRLQEFPPKSNLDPEHYGDQTSTITRDDIESQLEGLTVDEAIKANRLFILNHHDSLMPYVRRINDTTSTKMYASRTFLFLLNDGRLKPLAIELSLPHPDGDQLGPISKVYTPSEDSIQASIWQLAKAYVAVNDSGIHELISHWLHTHAVTEPIIIATNRQLSVLHPVHKLLHPHFRDTMNINAIARQILIDAGGMVEATVFPAKYAMELSSVIYKDWVFPDQALPVDLVKRGMAVEDSNAQHGVRLLIEDYPYAVDGLEIWSAIKTWVEDYINFYYPSDEEVSNDTELQSWWTEIREKGHGDKKDEPWWPEMKTRKALVDSCTIIIWVGSALHASTNFGQYPYAGYGPNRPTISRRFMPEPGSKEYDELSTDPDKVLLKTITARLQTLIGIALIEILSRHASDEVYLGQRDTPDWTKDGEVIAAFEKFGRKLNEVQEGIVEKNNNEKLKNRVGPVNVPYTLLYPTSETGGITGKGIPNSVAI